MNVKVDFDDADAKTKIGALEKKLQSFQNIMERAGNVGVKLGYNIERAGIKTTAYGRTIKTLADMMLKTESTGNRLASAVLHVVGQQMEFVGTATTRAGSHILRCGAAIMDFGRKVHATLTPYAQWIQKSVVAKVALVGLKGAAVALGGPLMGVGYVGVKAFQGVVHAAKSAYNQIGGITGIIGRLKGGLLGMAGSLVGPLSLDGIAKIGDSYDQINIDLAQTIKLMSKDAAMPFAEAFEKSEGMMAKIVALAGPLPGKASDYARAMALAGVTVNRATGDQKATLKLISDMTAVWGGDGVMAAKILNQALGQTKGRLNEATANGGKLFKYIKSMPEYTKLTSAEFNRMALDKRYKIVAQAMELSQDQITALANTYDAKMGAAKANTEWLVKAMSPKILNVMKKGLDIFNDSILDSEGHFTSLAQSVITVSNNIADFMIKGMEQAGKLAKDLKTWFDGFVQSENFESIKMTADSLLTAASKAGGAFIGGLGGADAVQERLEAWGDMVTAQVLPIFAQVATVIEPLAGLWGGIANVALDSLYPALLGLFQALDELIGPLTGFYNGIIAVAMTIINYMRPKLIHLGQTIGTFFRNMVKFITPVLRVFLYLYQVIAKYLTPVLGVVVDAFAAVINAIGQFLAWLGGIIGSAADKLGIPQLESPTQKNGALGEISDFFEGLNRGAPNAPPTSTEQGGDDGDAEAKTDVPGARGGGKTVQDFRFGRFEISQKFDESFDPDRVATAFASQLSRIGDRKLQSGFEPLFSVSR
jgi:hypothetical protein